MARYLYLAFLFAIIIIIIIIIAMILIGSSNKVMIYLAVIKSEFHFVFIVI